jgi:hypothetical protein
MAKVMISEQKAALLGDLIKATPNRTPFDYAQIANRELKKAGVPGTLEPYHVHNYLNHHPDGEKLRENVAVSASSRRTPNWADENTPKIEDQEHRPGELVAFVEKTGDRSLDDVFDKSMGVIAQMAHYIPASKQENVVALGAALNYIGNWIKTREQVFEVMERERKTNEKYIKTLEQQARQQALPPAAPPAAAE